MLASGQPDIIIDILQMKGYTFRTKQHLVTTTDGSSLVIIPHSKTQLSNYMSGMENSEN